MPGTSATPLIELDGAGAGSGTNGLVLAAGSSGSVVNGLVVSGFAAAGISISSNNDLVEACYIGTNAAGSAALANTGDGIDVYGASETIGGTTAGERNLISGNLGAGINILPSGQGTVVTGNFVGTDVSGSYAIANVDDGLIVYGSDNTIGGTASGAGNLFSGNDNAGILLYETGCVGNLVEGNLIGTSASGSQALGNTYAGVDIQYGATANTVGGTSAAARNVLSANGNWGVIIFGTGTTNNLIEGDYLGTNAAGTAALGNVIAGIGLGTAGNIVGGTAPGAGNLISGNAQEGINVGAGSQLIEGNIIGTQRRRHRRAGQHRRRHRCQCRRQHDRRHRRRRGQRHLGQHRVTASQIVGSGATGNLVEGDYHRHQRRRHCRAGQCVAGCHHRRRGDG